MAQEKSEMENFLDDTYKTRFKVPAIVPKYKPLKKSKIEIAGKEVVDYLIDLAKNTDMSYTSMGKRVNEEFKLEITRKNVVDFFKTNMTALIKLAEEQKSLSKIRADLYLEPNKILSKDIKLLDNEIANLLGDELLESDKRAKAVADILDKKGRLLLRHARLGGRFIKENPENKVQVNIFQEINAEKSDVINRLKKAEFKEKKIIDVEAKCEPSNQS